MLSNARSRELLALRAEVGNLETKLRGLELENAHLQRKIPRLLSEHAALSVRAAQAESAGANVEEATARREAAHLLRSQHAAELEASNQSAKARLSADLERVQVEAQRMLSGHAALQERVIQAEAAAKEAQAGEESARAEMARLRASQEAAERWSFGFQSEILRLTTELDRTRAEASKMGSADELLRREADSSAEIAKQLRAARQSAQDQSSTFQARDLERIQELRVLRNERDLLLENVSRDRDCLQDLESALNAVGGQLEETRAESATDAEAARLVLEDRDRRVAECSRELDVAQEQIAELQRAQDRAPVERGDAVGQSLHEAPESQASTPTRHLEEEEERGFLLCEDMEWDKTTDDDPNAVVTADEAIASTGAGSTTYRTLIDRLRQAALDSQ